MTVEHQFVLDANIIVSASLFKNSTTRQVLDKAQTYGIVMMSVPVLLELEEVLARPKFDKYLSSTERKLFLTGFIKTVQFVEINEVITICRDPKDNKYLELAVSGKAHFIISGDADLLVLDSFRGIPILTVTEFLKLDFI